MSNTPSTPKPSSFGEVRKFPPGYGQFPYLIIRMHYGVYMQVPIQLSPPEPGAPHRPGTQIPNLNAEQLAAYAVNLDSEVHDILVYTSACGSRKPSFTTKAAKSNAASWKLQIGATISKTRRKLKVVPFPVEEPY